MASKEIRKQLFFTSDLHFGHRNILKYCPNRAKLVGNTEDIKLHDKIVIDRWNGVVEPEDTVIVVGDIKMCGNTYTRECLSQLKGKKILILGNHDSGRNKMMNFGFDWACYEMVINIQGTPVRISHYPYRPSLWTRFKGWITGQPVDTREWEKRPFNRGGFLIHGHTHSTKKVKNKMIHVGLDAWNMTPVSVDQIASLIGQIKKGESNE